MTLDFLQDTKYSAVITIILGAIGSLLAAAIAFFIRSLINKLDKRSRDFAYKFGWIGGFTSDRLEGQSIVSAYLITQAIRIIVLCLGTVCFFIISGFFFISSPNTLGYLSSFIFLTVGLFLVFIAYSDYRILRDGVDWWIEKLREGANRKGGSSEQKTPKAD